MGVGCTRANERVAAAKGQLPGGAEPSFEENQDVNGAGVLFAIPALLSNGLLDIKGRFSLPEGYYRIEGIFLLLGMMALQRVKTIEALRYLDPGEMGKPLGLDRVPEARTLRMKLSILSETGDPKGWQSNLSQQWMTDNTDCTGSLYIDGHVRLYHGHQTKLPKRYVARERLCLRGVTDYWVNDKTGRPFFVIYKTVNTGLIKVLRDDIVPRLLKDIPGQPDESSLEDDTEQYRFELIFDREGYSPVFFEEMWKSRIAVTTYRKNKYESWPEEEFEKCEVLLATGMTTTMELAERFDVELGTKKIKVREVRRLTASGHQTAIVTTNTKASIIEVAAHMFARWSQENFFKYMRQHFGIDQLAGYDLHENYETAKVVNPDYRQIQTKIRSKQSKLNRLQARLGQKILDGDLDHFEPEAFLQKQSENLEQVSKFQSEIEALKSDRKAIQSHIDYKDLPPGEQFKSISTPKKYLIDTVKMIAYRAETALANSMTPHLAKPEVARSFIRQVLTTDADLLPDYENNILHVSLHNLSNPQHIGYARKLCDLMNETATIFPGTKLRIFYDLESNEIL